MASHVKQLTRSTDRGPSNYCRMRQPLSVHWSTGPHVKCAKLWFWVLYSSGQHKENHLIITDDPTAGYKPVSGSFSLIFSHSTQTADRTLVWFQGFFKDAVFYVHWEIKTFVRVSSPNPGCWQIEKESALYSFLAVCCNTMWCETHWNLLRNWVKTQHSWIHSAYLSLLLYVLS